MILNVLTFIIIGAIFVITVSLNVSSKSFNDFATLCFGGFTLISVIIIILGIMGKYEIGRALIIYASLQLICAIYLKVFFVRRHEQVAENESRKKRE